MAKLKEELEEVSAETDELVAAKTSETEALRKGRSERPKIDDFEGSAEEYKVAARFR